MYLPCNAFKVLASKKIFLISTVFPQGKYKVCGIGCHIKLFKDFQKKDVEIIFIIELTLVWMYTSVNVGVHGAQT